MRSKDSLNLRRSRRLFVEQLETRLVPAGLWPVGIEQQMLEQLNDIRADPAAYGVSIGVNLSNVPAAPALTFDPLLEAAAYGHAQDMNTQGYLSQTTPQGVDPGQRLTAAGFDWTTWGESNLGGSVYTDTASVLKSLIIDAGDPSLSTRDQLLGIGTQFQGQEQVGIGIVQGGTGPLQNYYTIDTAEGVAAGPFLTGVVFKDVNGNDRYATGEGLPGVVISVGGTVSGTTATFTSGGYSIALPVGNYTVTASGGGLASPVTQDMTMGTTNIRLNFVVPNPSLPAGANAWVIMLYQDVLGRTPAPSEMAGWVAPLLQGSSRLTVVDAFLYSQEYTEDLVTQWFQQYLGRSPDGAGLAYFSNALMQGVSEDSVQLGILESQEFFAKSGGTDTGFVTALYQDILGRTPGGTEDSGWVSQAATNPGAVAAAFLECTEFKTTEVEQLYSSILRRGADKGGLGVFVAELQGGQDERSVLASLLTSAEYYNNAPNILWIQSLYANLLNRNGTSAEIDNWVAALNSGESPAQIAAAFTASTDWDQVIVTQQYQAILGREPDPSGLTTYINMLQGTGIISDVTASLAGSAEFLQKNGSSYTTLLTALYQDIFNRAPLATEISYWLGQIQANGWTMPEVVAEFVNSPEYLQFDIENMYSLFLHRTPLTSEYTTYGTALSVGQSDADIAARILSSTEYIDLVAS